MSDFEREKTSCIFLLWKLISHCASLFLDKKSRKGDGHGGLTEEGQRKTSSILRKLQEHKLREVEDGYMLEKVVLVNGCRFDVDAADSILEKIMRQIRDVPKGYLTIMVGQGEDQMRVVVPVKYFKHPLFMQLLQEAEEFGFDQKGIINIPCHIQEFQQVRGMIDKEMSLHRHHHYFEYKISSF
ncbi:hypothetical protein GIB67_028027 [Kingdonia uniflora]|uniref:Uncharacterized protein n=1 Tax=Kingdonia uniflora TaxID=39325 RepID=A0A7J7NF20_9MAGN|nr:hypothetical protein GIB67_028027 [Kingdonia uniflora]